MLETVIKQNKSKLLAETGQAVLEMEEMLKRFCISKDALIESDLSRLVISGGKRLRPVLAYLCYRLAGKEARPILPLMCMLELMHTASLIHDDVIDGATERRGVFTVNCTSGNHRAIQSGDFLLAGAMKCFINIKKGYKRSTFKHTTQMCFAEYQPMKYLNV
jgi:geranylgeranyl pyrophosphate synthase